MRDINRLDDFYDELNKVHKECFPDWRFGQFMCNLQRWLQGNKGLVDMFYIEEYEMLRYINEFVESIGVK